MTETSFTVDDRLRSYMTPLREDEFKQLEENIRTHGCQSPLIVWNGILLDGHNRYSICSELGLPYRVEQIELDSFEAAEAWIEENQLGRRNLTADQFAYYVGRKYARLKKAHGGDRKTDDAISSRQNDDLNLKTSSIVAAQHGIGARTVERAASYAADVDTAADALGDGVRSAILSGNESLTRKDVSEIAKVAADAKEQRLVFNNPKEALDWAKSERQLRAAVQKTANENLKALNPVIIPSGKYTTIVIDPPWDMQKIERDVAPNQVGFDYPTMNEDELAEFDVEGMSHDHCHLFCWTTQKFLPMTLRLIEQWGFRYVLTMVWHKNGGFQPFGMPQYNCEFAVYARKGTPIFMDTKAFPTCFNAPRREHSRKPDEFYDVIRRVTDGDRIDVFSREARDGFAQFGNEADKFSEAS